jgi:ubiquinone/menaquinone biosynthesis C-methylase UbiE
MRRRLFLALLVAAFAAPAAGTLAQNNPRDADRLIKAMGVEPGMTVGEIGAGTGDLSLLFARHVGERGAVFTTEINPDRLADIRKAVDASSLRNITVLEAGEEVTNLPPGCCDAIFMRNVYHHFSRPAAINRSLFASLKPGGRLAVIDFPPGNGREGETAADRAKDGTHGVFKETVAAELKRAGFEQVSAEEPGDRQEGFLVVMRKPAASLAGGLR